MEYNIKIASLLAAMLLGSNAAQASLLSSGPGLVYDNVANVTWTSDANLFATMAASNPNLVNTILAAVPTVTDTPNVYDTPANSGTHTLTASDFQTNGQMNWFGAMAWSKYLDSINYLGHNTWMLPTTYDQTCINTYNCTNSMLGELYFTGLSGNVLFTNIQAGTYWSGTEYASTAGGAWYFVMNQGYQTVAYKTVKFYSWAVLPGNAAASMPEPGSIALLLLGLGMLEARARLRRG